MTDNQVLFRRTILNISHAYNDYPYVAIEKDALRLINSAKLSLPKHFQISAIPTALRAFECYLQITDQKISCNSFKKNSFTQVCEGFIGAIHSTEFINIGQSRKTEISKVFLCLVKSISCFEVKNALDKIQIQNTRIMLNFDSYISKYLDYPKDEHKIWLWQGWPLEGKSSGIVWAHLYPMYSRLGRKFTENFYEICKVYMRGRRRHSMGFLTPLSQFIFTYPHKLDGNSFKDQSFVNGFLRQFMEYYFRTKYANGDGAKISTLIALWRREFRFFIEEYLMKDGLFARTTAAIPMPPIRRVLASNTNIKKNENGELVRVKLLTNIPLNITDDEAINLIFSQVNTDFNIALDWGRYLSNSVYTNYKNRLKLASTGVVRHYQVGEKLNHGSRGRVSLKNDPKYLQNAAATLQENIHIANTYEANRLLGSPLDDLAKQLGMPVTGALLGHCMVLVANHPQITPSFLENFQLFDKNGKLVGYINSDERNKLIGFKYRRGSKLAEQVIILNDETSQIVEQLIEITTSLREFLKAKHDDAWRYLLLTCKQGFCYPARIKKMATETSEPIREQKLVESLSHVTSLSLAERESFVRQFSLSSLRASAGVLVYFKTRSVSEMAKALGHAKFDPKLIQRYLPAPLLAFFEERWIRIFQTGIILEALKDSPYRLTASGFKSFEEMDIFLKNHIFKPLYIPDTKKNSSENKDLSEVIFGLDCDVLSILLSIQNIAEDTSKKLTEKTKYWIEISKQLIRYIESEQFNRPDLQLFLETARKAINPKIMDVLFFAKN